MGPVDPTSRASGSAADRLGDVSALEMLQELVAIAPTNLEDLAAHRLEKTTYPRAAEAIARWARRFGLPSRIYDPVLEREEPELAGIPRPNVIVDLDRGAEETVLVLAHYDVVPVPVEQRSRWRSPPHALTLRADGRLYGRGANDDLGSGITATLLAMRRLAENDRLGRNVRLLACCDEETGGIGGIEALRSHDEGLPAASPDRIVRGDVALIPDGSPHTTLASSGVAFLEGSVPPPATLRDAVRYGRVLVGLHELASSWRSGYPSPDWPERGAPEAVITGRASVTRFDLVVEPAGKGLALLAAHAESDAANQIARAVTLAFGGSPSSPEDLVARLGVGLPPPFQLAKAGASALAAPAGAVLVQLVGVAAHGGYPHRGHNPVPATLDLLARALDGGVVRDAPLRSATFTVDLRLTPEMELDAGTEQALRDAQRRWGSSAPRVELVAPPARCRPGYALVPKDPWAVRLERIVRAELGGAGFFGEYGGTDASSLRGLVTPTGSPLPAMVFGSMDPQANIHDAEESVDPRLLAGVARTVERFALEP